MNQLVYRFFTSAILLLIVYISFINSIILFLLLILLNYFAIKEFNEIYKKIFKNKSLFVFLFLIISVVYLALFSLLIWWYLVFSSELKSIYLIFILLICVCTDIGGFVFGKLIGGKKFTKISPNKTYSGILGAFLFSISIGSFFYSYFDKYLSFNESILLTIIVISFISQIGDLIISFLKRKANIKDTGSLLPGHGGILDRIDGILFAVPFGILITM